MAFRLVAGRVTGAAVVRSFLTRMIFCPAAIRTDDRVGKVVLVEIGFVPFCTGNDVPIFAYKAIFPVVATNYVADIIPSISFGKFGHFGEGVCWGLAINNFVELVGVA